MKNDKGCFDQLRHFLTSEQELRCRSHLYKRNSTCFLTQIIHKYRVLLKQ